MLSEALLAMNWGARTRPHWRGLRRASPGLLAGAEGLELIDRSTTTKSLTAMPTDTASTPVPHVLVDTGKWENRVPPIPMRRLIHKAGGKVVFKPHQSRGLRRTPMGRHGPQIHLRQRADRQNLSRRRARAKTPSAGRLRGVTIDRALQNPWARGRRSAPLRVTKVECVEVSGEGRRHLWLALATPNNPMERTLSDLVGSAVVFDLQQLIETYLPVVGT